MQIDYSVSLWNFYHYADVPSLERLIASLKELGFGVELWGEWKDEKDLYDEVGRRRLKYLLDGMKVSLHAVLGTSTFELHKKQIDAASELGAEVMVIHPDNIASGDRKYLDAELSRDVVAYANELGIRIALENGEISFLVNAIERVDGLGICLDVGHVYFTQEPMSKYPEVLKRHIIHLHIEDILSEEEYVAPHVLKDHYIPGTGRILDADWILLTEALREVDFQGIAVFEIQPRNPFQTAFLGKTFMQKLLET